MAKQTTVIGLYDHWGWALAMTATASCTVLDRRRLELIAPGLPKYPYHHDAQGLSPGDARQMIEAVEASITDFAKAGLDSIEKAVKGKITGIAMRKCPELPETLAERLRDYFAQNNADSVMYRHAIAKVARARGWQVHWYEANTVIDELQAAIAARDIDVFFNETKKQLGTPWTKEHRLALAAAIVAAKKG